MFSPCEKRGKWEGRRHLERGGIARATGRVQLSGRGIVPLGLESNYSAGNGFCTADPLHFVSAHGYWNEYISNVRVEFRKWMWISRGRNDLCNCFENRGIFGPRFEGFLGIEDISRWVWERFRLRILCERVSGSVTVSLRARKFRRERKSSKRWISTWLSKLGKIRREIEKIYPASRKKKKSIKRRFSNRFSISRERNGIAEGAGKKRQ